MTTTHTSRHEAPVIPATTAAVLGPIAWFGGLVLPEQNFLRHVLLSALFGLVAVSAGWRTQVVAGRRVAPRIWAGFGLLTAAVGLGMLVYQLLVLATHGVVPPPFWAPFLGSS